MIVDCDRCEVRGGACQDCVITVLLGNPPSGVESDGPDRQALDSPAEPVVVTRLQLIDRHADADTTWTMIDINAGLRNAAERSAVVGERSRRDVN